MIIGTGIDIVEIDRFKESVKKYGSSFLKKIFTSNEISYSRKRRFSDQHFAARFATKEAVLKAFGDEPGTIRKWTDIEVSNDKNGKPLVDDNNGDVSLRKRPILGLPVAYNMKQTHSNKWQGRVYDPQRGGPSYTGYMTVQSDGRMKVQGCLAFICESEYWSPLEK